MIEFEGLAHIGLRVADFKRSIAFYRQFGFELIREDYNEHVVVLQHEKGIELNLLDSVNDANEGKNVLMDEAKKFAGYTHIAIGINDVKHAITKLNEINIAITEGPVRFGDGSTSVFFRDPDRNVIELSEPLHNRKNRIEYFTDHNMCQS